jgi:mono/diheme cytochrome c family protein
MSTLIEQDLKRETTTETAATAQAAPPARHPRKIWGVLMVSGAVCFGIVALAVAPSLYKPLVKAYAGQGQAQAAGAENKALDLSFDPAGALRGKALFAQGCNACHGDHAEGRVGLGKDLAHSSFVKSQGNTQLLAFLKKGRDVSDPLNTTRIPMPPKGGNPALNDKQLGELVAYIRSLNK